MATTFDPHDNLATSTIATVNSTTEIVVQSGHGARFPSAPFNATIHPDATFPDPDNAEIVRVTDVTSDTLTITRGQEGTSQVTLAVDQRITLTVTEKSLTDIEGALNTVEDWAAADVPYTPADGTDWIDPDPTDVGGALDSIAGSFTDLAAGYVVHTHDAVDTTYTPTTGADWADPDPTEVEGALDTLASEKIAADSTDTLTNKTISDFTNTVSADEVRVEARNVSGSTITAGTPVYISGYNVGAEIIEVEPADANGTATYPAIGVVEVDITNGSNGSVVVLGGVSNIDTSSFTAGDLLYLSETAGEFTTTAPASNVQELATVLRSHATLGVIAVHGRGVKDSASAYSPTASGDWSSQPTDSADGLDILADQATAATYTLVYNDVDDYEAVNGGAIPAGAARRFVGDTDPTSAGGGSYTLNDGDEWIDTSA